MNYPNHLKKSCLAILIGMAFAPHSAIADLDFSHSPPGTVEPYVAPNVILSLDDSTSMQSLDMVYKGDWEWREHVLRESLLEVFNDKVLLPDGSIRLAWQSLGMSYNLNRAETSSTGAPISRGRRLVSGTGGCTVVSGKTFRILGKNVNTRYTNSMAVLDETHRENFLQYMSNFGSCTNTPTPSMTRAADLYMRATLHKNGPWADIPGERLASSENNNKPLGCRRNYHILLTDGDWNVNDKWNTSPVLYSNQSSILLPNGTKISKTDPQTQVYRSKETRNESSSIADWALKSWADPLQTASQLEGSVSPAPAYEKAPATETVSNRITGNSFTFDKFWNPKYDPATWPHMVTFTIGFSNAALPQRNYPSSCTNNRCAVAMTAPSTDVPYADDGNMADYASGIYTWRVLGNKDWGANNADRQQDMWRGAINGRGKFYAVRKADDLKKAFTDIIQTIKVDTQPAVSSAAASGSNGTRNDIGLYSASYDPTKGWSGSISAQTYKAETQSTEPAWGDETTATKLDKLPNINSRLILTANTIDGDEENRKGVSFKWNKLGEAEKLALGSEDDTPVVENGENIVNYIRGDRNLEGITSEKPFRERTSRQGDIVNSNIWYLAEPIDFSNISRPSYAAFSREWENRLPMIYVGGNDGMLHGFSAKDGSEKIAYVPHGLLSEVPQLTQHAFDSKHRYFVDGSPFSGDIFDKKTNAWQTVLVGTLGAGGKGYFVLDVTDPSAFTEANAEKLVIKDMTLSPRGDEMEALGDGYLGHIFAKPVMDDNNPQRTVQIARLNNDRYAAVLGNGYGSTNGEAALLIQYLDGDKEMLPLPAPLPITDDIEPLSNGLSAPRLVDINGDGRPDVVYAGDLHGNMWKFLINTGDDKEWAVAEWHNTLDGPLFTANLGDDHSHNVNDSTLQAITAAPSVKISERRKKITVNGQEQIVPVVGMMVSFGTGRNVTTLDPAERQQQTLYSVLDNTVYQLEKDSANKPTGRVLVCDTQNSPCDNLVTSKDDLPHSVQQNQLVQRSIPDIPADERDSRKYWTIDDAEPLDFAKKKGWYMNFPMPRERLLKNMSFYASTNMLMVVSQVPAKGSNVTTAAESCEGGSLESGGQYLTFINIQDGKAFSEDILRSNTSGDRLTRTELPQGGDGDGLLGFYANGGSDLSDPNCDDCGSVYRMLDPTKNKVVEDLILPRVEPLRPTWRQMQ